MTQSGPEVTRRDLQSLISLNIMCLIQATLVILLIGVRHRAITGPAGYGKRAPVRYKANNHRALLGLTARGTISVESCGDNASQRTAHAAGISQVGREAVMPHNYFRGIQLTGGKIRNEGMPAPKRTPLRIWSFARRGVGQRAA